jgi:hypothetical protein
LQEKNSKFVCIQVEDAYVKQVVRFYVRGFLKTFWLEPFNLSNESPIIFDPLFNSLLPVPLSIREMSPKKFFFATVYNYIVSIFSLNKYFQLI